MKLTHTPSLPTAQNGHIDQPASVVRLGEFCIRKAAREVGSVTFLAWMSVYGVADWYSECTEVPKSIAEMKFEELCDCTIEALRQKNSRVLEKVLRERHLINGLVGRKGRIGAMTSHQLSREEREQIARAIETQLLIYFTKEIDAVLHIFFKHVLSASVVCVVAERFLLEICLENGWKLQPQYVKDCLYCLDIDVGEAAKTFSWLVQQQRGVSMNVPNDADEMKEALVMLAYSKNLLGLAPLGLAECELVMCLVQGAENVLSAIGIPALDGFLEKRLVQLESKAAYLERRMYEDTRLTPHVTHARAVFFDAAISILEKEKNAAGNEVDSTESISRLIRQLEEKKTKEAALAKEMPFLPARYVEERLQELEKGLVGSIEDALNEAEIFDVKVSGAFKRALLERLNQGSEWRVLEAPVQYVNGGRFYQYTNRITPASAFGNIFDNLYADTKGVSSGSLSEKKHAVNLARTEVLDSKGNSMMRLLRSGVLCACGIEDCPSQEEGDAVQSANLERAKEWITAQVVANPEILAEAIRTAKAGCTYHVSVVSLSLLTTDEIRKWLASFGYEQHNERGLWSGQRDALKALRNAKNFAITVLDENGQELIISLSADIAVMNFGVNAGAHGVISNNMRVWSKVHEDNEDGLRRMVGSLDPDPKIKVGGWAENYLTKLERQIQEARKELKKARLKRKQVIIEKLALQIRKLWNDKAYKKPGNDPYKLQTRILALANLTKVPAGFNCKSGIDRTGQLDAEIKFLMHQIHATGDVPEPDAEFTKEDRHMYHEIVLDPVNFWLQILNRAVPGYKNVAAVKEIADRLKEKRAKKLHTGLSATSHI